MSKNTENLNYDGSISDLYKIYLVNLLLTILTLGLYHFWAKTRKRRYIASSLQLKQDRFEYTGYGSELFYGLSYGLFILLLLSTPLYWSIYTIYKLEKNPPETTEQGNFTKHEKEEERSYHIEQFDHLKKNKIIIDFKNINSFWIVINNHALYFKFEKNVLDLEYFSKNRYGLIDVPISFTPKEHPHFLLAVLLVPLYLAFYIIYLPFVIVFGSLKYRASRLRWRGIRSDLSGSPLTYAALGFFHTFMKFITLGFWIPISDVSLLKFKMNQLHFGNQKFTFSPSYRTMIFFNLATIGASLYLIALVYACGYWGLPLIADYPISESAIVQRFLMKLAEKEYVIFAMLLLWICYTPRYAYRAALLREKYNALSLGKLRFQCTASSSHYFKLFVTNDLLFIFTLGFALPIIWHRRMKFVSTHIKILGDVNTLHVKQVPHEKTRFGGGLASLLNLDVGLI